MKCIIFYRNIWFLIFLLCELFISHSVVNSETDKQSERNKCYCKNYVIISTLDGTVTALDLNTGFKLWSVVLDVEKFLSSSLSKLELYENGQRFFLVPSLDGSLYKYDAVRKIIAPLPLNVDTLINHSNYIDPSNTINGGKMKIIHGINRCTGEVLYTCNMSGCTKLKTSFPENMLVIEQTVQSVNAIDSIKAEKSWHFRIVELTIKLASSGNSSGSSNETALISQTPAKFSNFLELDLYKISLEHFFIAKINKTRDEFIWVFKAPSPINDAWIVVDDLVELLDPFDKESGFHSIDIDDGQHSALLFLGIYEKERFIKRSRKLKLKNSDITSLAPNFMQPPIIIPVCLVERVSGPHLESEGTTLMPYYDDYNTDYGFYYLGNLSVAENATHCIVNHTYIKNIHMQERQPLSVYLWLTLAIFHLIVIIGICVIYKHSAKANSLVKSTCSVAVSSDDDFITVSSNEEFRSRFFQDFELISVLGKGGFGIVMDCKNRIDDCHYAVKRICLHQKSNSPELERVLREVKALAKLDHHGIVRYFNAWFEYPPAGWQEKKDKETNISDVSSSTSEDDERCSTLNSKRKSSFKRKAKRGKLSNPVILKKLNENPLKMFKSDTSSENEAVISKHVVDTDSHSNSSIELKDHDEFIKNSHPSSAESTDDSDSLIVFGDSNSSSNIIKDIKNVPLISCDSNYDGSEFSSELPHKNDLEKSLKASASKNGSARKLELSSAFSKKHSSCYETLVEINNALIYPLNSKEFEEFTLFIFWDKTKYVADTSQWKAAVSKFTNDELIYYKEWLTNILFEMEGTPNFTCNLAEGNCYTIMSDIESRLKENESPLNAVSPCIKSVNVPSSHGFEIMKNQEFSKGNFNEEVPIQGFSTGYLYIQMQLCQKESLREWLQTHSDSRDYNKVMEIFVQIVDAVHYVHRCGLMHRDLKPSNIFFSMEGAIKIGDFGLATSFETQKDNESSHKPSHFHTSDIGTDIYMSPEQKLNEQYNSKTDIYSLGIIFFELLVPFQTFYERNMVLHNVRQMNFPEEFERNFKAESQLLRMLLHDNPENRPTTSQIKEHPVLKKFM